MDTVANTHEQNENRQRLPHRKQKLRLHFMRAARRMLARRMDYYSEPDLFDYAREDAALMEEFFNWLERTPFNVECILHACVHYLIHADVPREEKKKLGDNLNKLSAFCIIWADYSQTIAEKAYYYASVREELDAVKACQEEKAAAAG